jgi:hypothetical protein
MKKEIKLNFRITNPNNLIVFLKKLKTVDRSVILELEGSDFFAKVRTPDKSVIKYVGTKVDDFFDGETTDQRVKIGILEIGKLIDVFKYFGPEEETFMEINSQSLEGQLVATGFRVYSSSINIKFKCADISLLSYIPDNIQKSIHTTEGATISFNVSKESFAKLSSLTTIENNSEELLNFEVHSSGLSVKGNSFQYNIIKGSPLEGYSEDSAYSIYKNQFNFIDQENSSFHVQENRIVVMSEESDSIIAIGLVEV